MKNIKFNLPVFLMIVIFFSINLFAEDFEGGKKVSKGDKLEVSISNGNIVVAVWAKDEVYVKAKNIDVEDVKEFSFKQTGNIVSFKFKGQNSNNFNIEISIPAYMILNFSTGGGNITLEDKVNGSVEISTGGGNVSLNDVGNELSVSTGGGNISVGNVNGVTELSTGGGNISVKDVKNKIEVSTGGGNISIGNIGGNGEVSTAGGNVSVGKVSGSAELNTAGGNINLDGAIGKVEVNTAGGNISLKNISGSVDANTAGGNIYADLTPSDNSQYEFNTASGDIDLLLPSDAKVSIVATVYIGKHTGGDDAEKFITSDFDPTTVNFDKYNLIKKFILNGGGSTIDLNTASGKIKINKK